MHGREVPALAALAERRELVLLNKIDAIGDRNLLAPIQRKLEKRGRTVLRASGVSGEGIPELLRALWRVLEEERALRAHEERA